MLVGPAVAAQTSVDVVMKDGTRTALEVADGLTLRVDGDMLCVDGAGSPSFAIEEVRRLEYGRASSVDDAVGGAHARVSISGKTLLVESDGSGMCRMVDTAGRTMLSRRFNGNAGIDVSDLAPGVYVVSAGDAPAVKISVR